MAARFFLFLLTLVYLAPEVHALSPKEKAISRFVRRCADGDGKSCFDAGQLYWAKHTNSGKKTALRFFSRACELKYSTGCEMYSAHSTRSVHLRKHDGRTEGVGDICFSVAQFGNASFVANTSATGITRGLVIKDLKPNSFWERAGLKPGDIIVKANNQPFNNSKDAEHALSTAGKKFGFEVSRADETITLWYSCK